jgi:hypothetical protein
MRDGGGGGGGGCARWLFAEAGKKWRGGGGSGKDRRLQWCLGSREVTEAGCSQ